MASATDTAKPERRLIRGSRLARLIVALNLVSLAILLAGALAVNEQRQALVNARKDSLTLQGTFLAELMAQVATYEDPTRGLNRYDAALVLQRAFIFEDQRARLFDLKGAPVIDSNQVTTEIEARALPPLPGLPEPEPSAQTLERARGQLQREVAAALRGRPITEVRRNESGERVVSVSIPVRRVRAVVGVLTLEASDYNEVVGAQRRGLLPFLLVAVVVSLLSSLMLARFVARPIESLARAADRVRLSGVRAISLPSLAARNDEIGDLTRALEAMTGALSERMDAIEAFAADVAHEIRNPLTSIRSAVETLDLVSDEKARLRLLGILKQDVQRLDRLVTDISNASRLDAELSREQPRPVDLDKLVGELISLSADLRREHEAKVVYRGPEERPVYVSGREGPLGQVFRNLIDNAKSFSPPEGSVRVSLRLEGSETIVTVEDDGPGIPPENLETVFERFYTSRPKGAAFGGNSGLGLSIVRQIVEAHGGRSWAENRLDEAGEVLGARFQVALPLAAGRTR